MESADALVEEKKLLNEPKYRSYMSTIDKALRNFEYSSEWADLISALGKLSKAISSNTQYQVIPRRIKISKRLAQCMHPALPSGVHLKALETYDVIFSKTGPDRLATELFIYSAGLFPLLGYAAMNVRPALLAIYEKYFVPLGEKLRPALSGFLSGVLPGYESGLDHYERTNSLLTQICSAVSPMYFYTCLWECVATNASIRLPAISYLLEHFNKRLGMKEQVYIMGHNHDVLMSGLYACLNDSVVLVQRNTLEFLLLGFPMHTPYLSEDDLIKLVMNGLNTILRRDMSLNRRLYSWMLGSEINKASQFEVEESTSYFDKYSKQILIKAFTCTLKLSLESDPVDLKPYRMLVSLLDKAEIGPEILDFVLCDVIRTMSLSSGNLEVSKSANLLFATFDPAYIWNFMTIMYEKSCKLASEPSSKLVKNLRSVMQKPEQNVFSVVGSGDPGLPEICFLTEYLLETISLEMYNETTRIYLPKVFLAITRLLTIYSDNLTYNEVSASLKLCMKIVSRVQPMITSPIKVVSSSKRISNGQQNKNSTTISNSNVENDTGIALEKSKSDSKLNQFKCEDDEPIRRSNSNHYIDKKSPTKTKKAKSYSKLLDLDERVKNTSDSIHKQSSDLNAFGNTKNLTKNELSQNMNQKTNSLKNENIVTPYEEKKSSQLEQEKDSENPLMKVNESHAPEIDNIQNSALTEEYGILEKCIKQYEIFYEVYLSRQILQLDKAQHRNSCSITVEVTNGNTSASMNNIFQNEEVYEGGNIDRHTEIDRLFETLKVNVLNRTTHLQHLLNKSIIVESSSDLSDVEFKDCLSSTEMHDDLEAKLKHFDEDIERAVSNLIRLTVNGSLRNVIKLASNLLVEMSTFPNCDKNLVLDQQEMELPNWLKVLSLVACYTEGDKELQLSAISTLFDLISLLKSQMEHHTSPGVTFVVMLPLLKFGHVSCIENKTRIFQLLTSVLWNYLGNSSTDPAQVSSLLYQLHSCLESGIVEAIIGNIMSNTQTQFSSDEAFKNILQLGSNIRPLFKYKLDRLADIQLMRVSPTPLVDCCDLYENESSNFKKFELLWCSGRDKQPDRGFEKTLLSVLDTLALPCYIPLRTLVTKWLQISLLRGDLSRIIAPLCKILLSSSSKRVGVVHAHLIKKDTDESLSDTTLSRDIEDDPDTFIDRDIYAISSEYGNVKYHMDASHNKKRSPIRSLQKKIFGVTLGNKNKTSNFVSDKGSPSLTENDSNIGLIINPLESSSDIEICKSEQGSLSSSVPNKSDVEKKNKAERDSDSEENAEYHSSLSPSNDSDDSCVETESEQRDNIAEKDSASNSLKRFVGDCERVTEALTEHDRTKNRKRYHLTRAGSEVIEKLEMSLTDVTEGAVLEESHTAEEYFSSSSGTAGTDVVENFMHDLIEQVAVNCEKKTKNKNRLSGKSNANKKPRKSSSSTDKKRMSCISKTSTDSNTSGYTLDRSINDTEMLSDSNNSNSDNDNEVFDEKSTNMESAADKKDNDIKKRPLSLGNTKVSWEIAKETLEKSKQNVEILRQNVNFNANGKRFSRRKISEERKRYYEKLHPYHTHILLYFGVYDTKQALYALQTLRNIISADARTFLCLSITTSIQGGFIKNLLMRHRKSILGKGFSGNTTNAECNQVYRGCMYLEMLVTICLYYARSYFQKEISEGNDSPTMEDITGNNKIQLESVELLTLICNELIGIVKGMGKGLACYIADLMMKSKWQKIILHCLNSSVLGFLPNKNETLTEQIIAFNQAKDEDLHAEALQVQLLFLLMAVIKLEHEVALLKNDDTVSKSESTSNASANSPTKITGSINVKYLPNCLISQQPMFLAAVLNALQTDSLRHLHRNWTDLITSSLNCFNFGSLTNIVISVIHQLCGNIDKIAKLSLKQQCNIPPDYVVSVLEALTVLCHYCLLDNTQQTSLSHLFNQVYPQTSVAVQSSNAGQLLNNIVHSFLSSQNSNDNQIKNTQHMAARNAVLSHLSRIVASVATIWDSELGQVRQVKQQLMEFLSPISLHHGVNFLAAISVTWQERGESSKKDQEKKNENRKLSISEQYIKNSILQASPGQLSLVKLVSSIRVMPMDSFVQTLHHVVKSPPPIHRPPVGLTIEVSALELFYFYMKNAPGPQLGDSWSSLLVLLRDGLNLTPPAQFVLLMLLNEFVQRCPQMPFQDKKDIRDLHDVTSRLVEALSNVAGACLEQTTWLRRNLAVKEDIPPNTPDGNTKDLTGNQQYCVQAQSVLASILANLLDVAYGAQEKDKVVAIITTLLYNVTPYLKNHTVRNIPSFYACSSLLANLSGYQYTRKAWRKDMLDLLLDPCFFQMDISCLPFWKQIMDSLMTYDNTTFRELMSRVSLAQTGGLGIFTSREQEYEQRALLLKRLAFVIYCSELDQYDKYMPEIQEQLANSLRLPNIVPSIQAAVLLCFRVLLLRMSPDHVTSLWPIIIAEMVQVYLATEQELKMDIEETNQLRSIDVPWVTASGNGLSSQNNLIHWRNVQLETAKLLELGCVLPASSLPHFQMYRWAFVGTEFDNTEEKILINGHMDDVNLFPGAVYVPHVRRIARLMDLKYSVHSPKTEFKRGNHLILTCQQISSLQDLYGFFSTLSVAWPTPYNFADKERNLAGCLTEIEGVLSLDFLEKMQTSTTPR